MKKMMAALVKNLPIIGLGFYRIGIEPSTLRHCYIM